MPPSSTVPVNLRDNSHIWRCGLQIFHRLRRFNNNKYYSKHNKPNFNERIKTIYLDGLLIPECPEFWIKLDGLLKVFFGKFRHSDVLQAEAEHPVKIRIVWRDAVGLQFVGGR